MQTFLSLPDALHAIDARDEEQNVKEQYKLFFTMSFGNTEQILAQIRSHLTDATEVSVDAGVKSLYWLLQTTPSDEVTFLKEKLVDILDKTLDLRRETEAKLVNMCLVAGNLDVLRVCLQEQIVTQNLQKVSCKTLLYKCMKYVDFFKRAVEVYPVLHFQIMLEILSEFDYRVLGKRKLLYEMLSTKYEESLVKCQTEDKFKNFLFMCIRAFYEVFFVQVCLRLYPYTNLVEWCFSRGAAKCLDYVLSNTTYSFAQVYKMYESKPESNHAINNLHVYKVLFSRKLLVENLANFMAQLDGISFSYRMSEEEWLLEDGGWQCLENIPKFLVDIHGLDIIPKYLNTIGEIKQICKAVMSDSVVEYVFSQYL